MTIAAFTVWSAIAMLAAVVAYPLGWLWERLLSIGDEESGGRDLAQGWEVRCPPVPGPGSGHAHQRERRSRR